jgi:aryl-alcohol dehydrogenase-like predicted oxidoreductase
VDDYRAIASDAGMSVLELAYAWLASRPFVDSVLVGPGTALHLEAAFRACERRLDGTTLERVDALFRAHQGTDAVYARL